MCQTTTTIAGPDLVNFLYYEYQSNEINFHQVNKKKR